MVPGKVSCAARTVENSLTIMISVIIPVYNAEKYIARCLGSLQNQTCRDWEAVCIDDGSTDGTGALLDSLSAADPRIRVIHTPNGGVSRARNTALENVRGEYILFLDSDDFLHPQTMALCAGRIEADSSDMVAFTYDRPYRTRNMIKEFLGLHAGNVPRFKKYDAAKVPFKVVDDIFDYASEYSRPEGIEPRWAVKHCQPWRCLYRACRIADLRFPEGIIYEDFPWWSAVLLRTRRATILNLPLYFYYPNLRSYITSSSQDFKIRSLQTALREAEALYADGVDADRKAKWTRNFLEPFRAKLESKLAKQ